MTKNTIINKLTLLDTSEYRNRGLRETGKYKHEPVMFRAKLVKIYEKLSEEDLKILLELKTK